MHHTTVVMPLDEKIEKAITTFGAAALGSIKNNYTYESFPKQIVEKIIFDEEGRYGHTYDIKMDYRRFFVNFEKILSDMEEARELGRLLLENKIIRPRSFMGYEGPYIENPTFDESWEFIEGLLWGVVVDYIEQYHTFDFEAEKFKKIFLQNETNWSESVITRTLIIPIVGLDSEITQINLPNGFVLERLTAEEKTSLWETCVPYWGAKDFDIVDYAKSKFKFYKTYKMDINDFSDYTQEMRATIGICITALRLLYSQKVAAVGLFESHTPRRIVIGSRGFSLYDLRLPKYDSWGLWEKENCCYLTAIDVERFIELFSLLLNEKTKKQLDALSLGLRRFNQAYTRQQVEDKIIDLTIALESTLLYGLDDKRELNYKFSLRGAALLNAKRNPTYTFTLLKILYDTRSKIVHDGKTLDDLAKNMKIGSIDKVALLPGTEQITREIFLEYIHRLTTEHNLQNINTELDNIIINSLKILDKNMDTSSNL